VFTPGTLAKALSANADEDGSNTVSLGDTLTYTVTVTNTSTSGNLTDVVVSDPMITPNTTTCASVAPGATCVLTGTYVVTAADVTAGSISNTAVVTSPVCPVGSTDPDCTTTVVTPVVEPLVTYSKTVVLPAGQTEVSAGDTLVYTLSLAIANLLIWEMIVYETRMYGEGRQRVRHPESAGSPAA